MDHYHIWCNLRPGVKDLDFSYAVATFLDDMVKRDLIATWTLQRRKLGLCSAPIGEWHIDMACRDLAQLDAAFDTITPRTGDAERLHAGVWSKVTDLHFALYRDFPDANRSP